MEKSLKIVAILFLLNVSICMATRSEKQKMMKRQFRRTAEACKVEVGAMASDIRDIIKKQPPAGMKGKCLRACLFKRFKLMNANGKYDKAVALENIKRIFADKPEKMKIAKSAVYACADIRVSDNACEAAELYRKCFHEQRIKHGLKNEYF